MNQGQANNSILTDLVVLADKPYKVIDGLGQPSSMYYQFNMALRNSFSDKWFRVKDLAGSSTYPSASPWRTRIYIVHNLLVVQGIYSHTLCAPSTFGEQVQGKGQKRPVDARRAMFAVIPADSCISIPRKYLVKSSLREVDVHWT
jgi:hypothetical protein